MKKHVLSFLFLFFVASAWSQTDTLCKSYYDYTATNILLPDHDTIWVGTGGGLIKQTISGTILNIYSSANSGVANNFVCALAIDSSGNILVGTAFQGVQRFDRHNAWTVLYPAIIATSLCYQVTGIVATGNGIWALGGAAPLSYYDGSIWTQYNSSNSIIPTNGGLTSIQKDGDTIWVSGSSAANTPYFIKIFGGVWTMYDYSTGLPSCVTSASFTISADHKIWMAGQNGVILCNGATYDTTTYNHGFTYYVSLVYDQGGDSLWVWGDNALWLLTSTSKTLVNYTSLGQYGSANMGLAEDQHSDIWLNTVFGIYKWDRSSWTLYDYSTLSVVNTITNAFSEDAHGSIYMATYTGLSKLANGNWSCPIKGQLISGLSRSPHGSIWVGSSDSGIYRIDTSGNMQLQYAFTTGSGIVAADDTTIWTTNQDIYRLTPNTITFLDHFTNANIWNCNFSYSDMDAHGNVWFAGDSGLVICHGTTVNTYSYPDIGGNGNTFPNYLTHDGAGGEYFLSTTGIYYYNGSIWSHFYPNNDSTINPSAALVDHNGNLWVGANFELYERAGSTWSWFNTGKPFGGGFYQIFEDSYDNIWLGYGFATSEICASDISNSIKPINDYNAINIYPNPANTNIHVKAESESDYPLTVSLINIQGRVMGSYILSSDGAAISIIQLPDGLYIADIQTTNHMSLYSKVVISR